MAEQYQSLDFKCRPLGPVWQDKFSYSHQPSTGGTSTVKQFVGPSFSKAFDQRVRGGFEATWSHGHPWPPSKGYKGAVGGPFRTVKRWFSSEPMGTPMSREKLSHRVNAKQYAGDAQVNFHYDIVPSLVDSYCTVNDILSSLSASSENSLMTKGTVAIERCKPTKTVNQLFVALTELKRDGIPDIPIHQFGALWRDFRAKNGKKLDSMSPKDFVELFHKFLQGSGSEYLNLVFGWLPLLSDSETLMKTYSKLPQIWAQYERDAGRRVRRSYSFPTEETTTSTNFGYGFGATPQMTTPAYTWYGSQKYDFYRSRSIRFTGAFCYSLPDRKDNTPLAELFRFAAWANKLYGISPTPDAIWNVIPWTWAADWFSNLGSVVSNLSDYLTNGLVLEYGYVTEHVRQVIMHYADFNYNATDHSGGQFRGVVYENRVLINRIEATPFGFGLNWNTFSSFQLAVLASLGISRR